MIGVLQRCWGAWPAEDRQMIQFVLGALSFQGASIMLIGLFLREVPLTWVEAFGFATTGWWRATWTTAVVCLLIVVVALQMGWAISQLITSLGWVPESQPVVQVLQKAVSLPRQVLYGVITVGLVPVGEELLFRGVLYPTVKQIGYPRLALWGVSLVFAATHMNLLALLPLTFVAIMLTLLYEETGNLLAPIVAHCFFNAANYVMLLNERAVNRWLQWLYERI